MTRTRHVPFRTCIVCGRKTDKRELTRVVAMSEGGVIVDRAGKMSGRGAYVCMKDESVSHEVKRGRLEHALRTKIGDSEWQEIISSLLSIEV